MALDPALRRLLESRERAAEEHTGYRAPTPRDGWLSSLPSYARRPDDSGAKRQKVKEKDKPRPQKKADLADVGDENLADIAMIQSGARGASSSSTGSGTGGGGSRGRSGGGRSGGGGGGGGGASELQKRLAGLDAELEAERKRLAAQFELAETDQERETLARAMAALERRGEEARFMIDNAYGDAGEGVGKLKGDAASRRQSEIEGLMSALSQHAERVQGIQAAMEGRDAGYGVGATLGGTDGGDAYAAQLAGLAGVEGALSGERSSIHQDDLDYLMGMLEAEGAAAQSEMLRERDDREATYRQGHDERVQQRIARERELLAQLDQGLLDMFMGRRGDLEQMIMQEQAARRAAASRGGGGGSRSSGAGTGGSTGDPELDQLLAARDFIDVASGNLGPEALGAYAQMTGVAGTPLANSLIQQVTPGKSDADRRYTELKRSIDGWKG